MQSDKLKRKQPSHSSEDKDLQTPQKKINTKFNEAKQMFRRTLTPTKLIGRNSERNTIQIFLNMTYKSKKNGSLYISGCPGTGKTALVKEILEKYDYLYINCMSTKSSDIFKAIKLKIGTKLELSDYFKNTSFLLVLDEIDSLLEKDNVVLYSLFEWASKGKLVLVGIANQLDLTSRFLPRLKAKNCKYFLYI
jgi:cell division control protein 6